MRSDSDWKAGEYMTWTAWCHQCDEWHTGLSPMEVVTFADTHIHPGIKCAPDFLLNDLKDQVFEQAAAALGQPIEGER